MTTAPLDLQLHLARMLHEKFCDQHGLSMSKAIALAPTLIELARKCHLKGITSDDIEQVLVCNTPKHVEDIIKYLPEAMDAVKALPQPASQTTDQEPLPKIFSQAHLWSISAAEVQQLKNIEYVECRSIREEALVILLKASEWLHQTDQEIAIIAENKRLIKTILSLAPLFEIQIKNGHEPPLEEAKSICFLKLVVQVVLNNFSPTSLLAMLKHECFACEDASIVQKLEMRYCRGMRKYQGLEELIKLAESDEIKTFLESLQLKFLPLIELLSQENVSLQSLLASTISVATALGQIDLQDFKALQLQPQENLITAQEFLPILSGLISKLKQPPAEESPTSRVRLLPLETCDLCSCPNIIFTDLNEQTADNCSAISQAVHEIIGLECDECVQTKSLFRVMQQERLLLTRSANIAGTPQLASRWFVWLKLLEKKFELNLNASYLPKKVSELYMPNEFVSYAPPEPVPPIKPRLTKLSVTQVERLMKNPYSIYAQCLLKLKPLEGIDRAPNQADFGRFIHASVSEFARLYDDSLEDSLQLAALNACAEEILAKMVPDLSVRNLWRLRFRKFAKWLVKFEKARPGKRVYTEVQGSLMIPTNCGEFKLVCIADRIEIACNAATIIDFKTGALPSNKDIASYTSPQLPLQACTLLRGGFEAIENVTAIQNLTYVHLAGSDFGKVLNIKGDMNKIVAEAERGIKALVEFYNDEATAFNVLTSETYNAYSHLIRSKEFM